MNLEKVRKVMVVASLFVAVLFVNSATAQREPPSLFPLLDGPALTVVKFEPVAGPPQAIRCVEGGGARGTELQLVSLNFTANGDPCSLGPRRHWLYPYYWVAVE